MNGLGVVNQSRYSMVSQGLLQVITLRGLNDVLMKDMLRARESPGFDDAVSANPLIVPIRNEPPAAIVIVQRGQSHAQNRRLQLIQPRIDSELPAHVPALPAVLAHRPQGVQMALVRPYHRAAITERTEILGRVETEGSEVAPRTDTAPAKTGTVRLCAVFNDWQCMRTGKSKYLRHIRRLTVQMHGHDRFGPACRAAERIVQAPRRHGVSLPVHVHEQWNRADPRDCRHGRHRRVRHRQHTVTRADPEHAQGKLHCVRAARHPRRPDGAMRGRKLDFELPYLIAKYVPAARQDAPNGGIDLIPPREIGRDRTRLGNQA